MKVKVTIVTTMKNVNTYAANREEALLVIANSHANQGLLFSDVWVPREQIICVLFNEMEEETSLVLEQPDDVKKGKKK